MTKPKRRLKKWDPFKISPDDLAVGMTLEMTSIAKGSRLIRITKIDAHLRNGIVCIEYLPTGTKKRLTMLWLPIGAWIY